MTDAEALKCIKDLKIFFQRKEDIFDDVLHEMDRVVAFNLFTKKRQMTLTDFMTSNKTFIIKNLFSINRVHVKKKFNKTRISFYWTDLEVFLCSINRKRTVFLLSD